jgi:hypothetical protein
VISFLLCSCQTKEPALWWTTLRTREARRSPAAAAEATAAHLQHSAATGSMQCCMGQWCCAFVEFQQQLLSSSWQPAAAVFKRGMLQVYLLWRLATQDTPAAGSSCLGWRSLVCGCPWSWGLRLFKGSVVVAVPSHDSWGLCADWRHTTPG